MDKLVVNTLSRHLSGMCQLPADVRCTPEHTLDEHTSDVLQDARAGAAGVEVGRGAGEVEGESLVARDLDVACVGVQLATVQGNPLARRTGRGRLSQTATRLKHTAGARELEQRLRREAPDALYDVVRHMAEACVHQAALRQRVLGEEGVAGREGEGESMGGREDERGGSCVGRQEVPGEGGDEGGGMGYWEAMHVLSDSRSALLLASRLGL